MDKLIFVTELTGFSHDARALRAGAARGRMVRIRRGVYCTRETWEAADDRARHILRVQAAMRDRQLPALVAAHSAAALHGLPILGRWPSEVTLLCPYAGGGKTEPGVRHTSSGGMPEQSVSINGIPVTGLARTALDLARAVPFAEGVAAMDWMLAAKKVAHKQSFIAELEQTPYRTGRTKLLRQVEFATAASGSFGESMARVVIHQLGFEDPELQAEFRDATGEMFTDFYWRKARVAGEFDGKSKYLSAEFNGSDPGEAVWREKKREDRLRRLGERVVRILWEHVTHPQSLYELLAEAGVPRRRSKGLADARVRPSPTP